MIDEDFAGVVVRDTVDAIVSRRNAALNAYGVAYDSLVLTNNFLVTARCLAEQGDPDDEPADASRGNPTTSRRSRETRFTRHQDAEKIRFHRPYALLPREEYLELGRRIVDTEAWSYLLDLTRVGELMDKTERDSFHQSLLDNPPPVTVENIEATVARLRAEAMTFFCRGLAKAFINLDRRYRSNFNWRFKRRMILKNVMDRGSFRYGTHADDTLRDVERVFRVLDGQPGESLYQSNVVRALGEEWSRTRDARLDVETDYFVCRTFINGNLHLWFKRKDLVEKANLLLAEYYGEVLAEGEPADEFEAKAASQALARSTPAKNFGFFPSPPRVVSQLLDDVNLAGKRVLEPSAGTGNIARAMRAAGARVTCVEIQPELASELRQDGFEVKLMDFLQLEPPADLYDMVVMNPPFDRQRDIAHVMHALRFVRPGGSLHAVMSASTETRAQPVAAGFRLHLLKLAAPEGCKFTKDQLEDWSDTLRGLGYGRSYKDIRHMVSWEDLPLGSFAECGTGVNTSILRVYVP